MNLNYILLDVWGIVSIAAALIILVIYGFFVYYALYSCFNRTKKMKAAYKTIKFVIAEKVTLVQKLSEICEIDLSLEDQKKIDSTLEAIQNNAIEGYYTVIEKMYNKVLKISSSLELDDEKVKLIETNVKFNEENDLLYRTTIDDYNTILLGYNYWTNFKITRPFTLMFRFHKKQNLY